METDFVRGRMRFCDSLYPLFGTGTDGGNSRDNRKCEVCRGVLLQTQYTFEKGKRLIKTVIAVVTSYVMPKLFQSSSVEGIVYFLCLLFQR